MLVWTCASPPLFSWQRLHGKITHSKGEKLAQEFVALAVICDKVKRTVQHCQERIMSTKHSVRDKASQVKFSKRLEMVNRSAAGVDVGSTEMWVCAPAGEGAVEVKLFGAYTRDLRDISGWLRAHGVATVAMESTGVYWIPLFQRLERDGFEVFLVNARFVKSVGGAAQDRHPRLPMDTAAPLLRAAPEIVPSRRRGLPPPRGRPPPRHPRQGVVHPGAADTEGFARDEFAAGQGHKRHHRRTGLRILEAILSGTRDPMALAELRDKRIAASKETVAAALEGDYRDEGLFIVRQCLDSYYAFRGQIDQ